MKKMICTLLALAMMLCSAVALAEAVAPQFSFDPNEGTYFAAFTKDNARDGMLNEVKLYTADIYDLVEINKLAKGDTFEAEGKTVTVETVKTNEYGDIEINGGFGAENGYTLTTREDTNGFVTTGDNDAQTYTERGTANLALAENVTFTDNFEIDAAALIAGKEPVKVEGIENVIKAINEIAFDMFTCSNTTVRIEDGKVVEIVRNFMP